MSKYIIYTNCLLYLWVSIAFINGMFAVNESDVWNATQTKELFITILLFSVLYSLVLSVGSILRKAWAIKNIPPWNIAIGIIIGIVPSAVVLFTSGIEMMFAVSNLNTVLGVVVGMALFVLAYLFHVISKKSRGEVKNEI